MKKNLLFLSLLLTVLFTSCSKDDDSSTLEPEQKKAITTSIKNQIISSIMPANTRSASLREAQTFKMTYDNYPPIPGPLGGDITMRGSSSYILNSDTSGVRYQISYEITDTYNAYSYSYDNMDIELNGELSIKGFYDITTKFNDNADYYAILGTNSYLTLSGVVNAKTSDFKGDIDFNLKISFNADGSGLMTGTVGGEAYSEVFSANN